MTNPLQIPEEAVQAAVEYYSEGGCMGLDSYERKEVAKSMLEAALPHLQLGYEVKQLSWRIFCSRSRNRLSETSFGDYVIQNEDEVWRLYLPYMQDHYSEHKSDELAEAAAQADFERRVSECIVGTLIGEGTKPVDVAAVREALKLTLSIVKLQNGNLHDDINQVIAQAERALSAEPVQGEQWQPTHRHVKRGTEYQMIGTGKMQSETWVDGSTIKPTHTTDGKLQITSNQVDMQEVAIYRGDDGQLWARPIAEFIDGRFEPLSAAPTSEEEA